MLIVLFFLKKYSLDEEVEVEWLVPETSATCILMHCNASSTTLLLYFVSNSRNRYWNDKLPSLRAQVYLSEHVCLWLRNEHGRRFFEEFTPHRRKRQHRPKDRGLVNLLQTTTVFRSTVLRYPSAHIWDLRCAGGSSRLPSLFSFIHLILF